MISGRDDNGDGNTDPIFSFSGSTSSFYGIFSTGDNSISNDMFIGTWFDETAENMKGFEAFRKDRIGSSFIQSISGLFVHELSHLLQNAGHLWNREDSSATDPEKWAGRWPFFADTIHYDDASSDCNSSVSVGSTLRYAIQDYNIDNDSYHGPISQTGNKIRVQYNYYGKNYDTVVALGGPAVRNRYPVFQGSTLIRFDTIHYIANNMRANYNMTAEEKFSFIVWWSQYYNMPMTTPTPDKFNTLLITISPNPSKNLITISSNAHYPLRIKSVSFYNINSKKMAILPYQNTESLKVDVSSYPAGVYIASVYTDKGVVNKRFVVVE